MTPTMSDVTLVCLFSRRTPARFRFVKRDGSPDYPLSPCDRMRIDRARVKRERIARRNIEWSHCYAASRPAFAG